MKSSQWVKLCDKITISADAAGSNTDAAKDAKEGAEAPAGEEKQLCSTIFEAIESNTGQLLASVRLEEVEGAPKRALAVTVPLGVVIPAGIVCAVYNADQWARAAKNETVELKELKTIGLKFSRCLPLGCTAEAEATEEVSDLLKGNAGIGVLARSGPTKTSWRSRCRSVASRTRSRANLLTTRSIRKIAASS